MKFVKVEQPDWSNDTEYQVQVIPEVVVGTVTKNKEQSWHTYGGRGIRSSLRGYRTYWTARTGKGQRVGYEFNTRTEATKALLEQAKA